MARQSTPRKSSAKQAAVAQRLLQVTSMAKHVYDQTFYEESLNVEVIRCVAQQDFVKGNVVVKAGQRFFLVQSERFAHYYYVVAWNSSRNCYQCSCGANCQGHKHIEKAVRHAASLKKAVA